MKAAEFAARITQKLEEGQTLASVTEDDGTVTFTFTPSPDTAATTDIFAATVTGGEFEAHGR